MFSGFALWKKVSAGEIACVALLLTLFGFSRVPFFCANWELNPDESQMLAQAMRFEANMTPWQSVDGATSGPINSWFLVFEHKLGAPYNYHTAHVTGALLMAVTMFLGWLTIRRLIGSGPAMVSFFLAVLWMSCSLNSDFCHYSSELIPSLLIVLGLCLACHGLSQHKNESCFLFLSGFALGCVPWAKLQGAVIALAVGLWIISFLVYRYYKSPDRPSFVFPIFFISLGAVLPAALLFGWLLKAGVFSYFWSSYFEANLAYAGDRTWAMIGHDALLLLRHTMPASVMIMVIGTVFVRNARPFWRASPVVLALSLVLLLCSLIAVLRPDAQLRHYQILLLTPFQLFTAILIAPLLQYNIHAKMLEANEKRQLMVLFVLAIFVLVLPLYRTIGFGYQAYCDIFLLKGEGPKRELVTSFVGASVSSGEPIAIWGHAPFLYVSLGCMPAARMVSPPLGCRTTPSSFSLSDYYLMDLNVSQPRYIVKIDDALWHFFHHMFKSDQVALAFEAYVAKNYSLERQKTYIAEDGSLIKVQLYKRSENKEALLSNSE
jgi:hypothetical protein